MIEFRLLAGLALAILLGFLAHRKRKSVVGWVLLSLFLPFLAAIIAFVRFLTGGWDKLNPTDKKCPHCFRIVDVLATKCGHCGGDLPNFILPRREDGGIDCPSCDGKNVRLAMGSYYCDDCQKVVADSTPAGPRIVGDKPLPTPIHPSPTDDPTGPSLEEESIVKEDAIEPVTPVQEILATDGVSYPKGFMDPTNLTKWVKILLIITILASLVAFVSDLLEYQLLDDIRTGNYYSRTAMISKAEASDRRQLAIGYIWFGIYLITAIVFLRWVHRSNYNARKLGADGLEFTPGWSVGWYFIPIACFWKPYQAMKEIWKASKNPLDWRMQSVDPILGWWWLLWITTSILSITVGKLSLAEDIGGLVTATSMNMVSDILEIPLCIIVISLVTKVTEMQKSHLKQKVVLPTISDEEIVEYEVVHLEPVKKAAPVKTSTPRVSPQEEQIADLTTTAEPETPSVDSTEEKIEIQLESGEILFECDGCGFTKAIPEKYTGKLIKCPECKTPIWAGVEMA
jgi:hypothetical protein